jgi:hypothetical protein
LIFRNENGISVQPHGRAYITGREHDALVPREQIEQIILLIPGHQVMLDADLAELYEVETKAFNRAVTRNMERFPDDFMFRLTKKEYEDLRYHFGTSRWGGRRYLPYVFTEQGVAI